MSIQVLSAESFRQKLAGLVDEQKKLPEMEQAAVKDMSIRFVSILASLFSDDLDRKTLWDRIGHGLITANAKSNGDYKRFVTFALEYIKAEPGKVAASAPLMHIMETMEVRPAEWKSAFLNYIETRRFLVLIKARALWQEYKDGRVEL